MALKIFTEEKPSPKAYMKPFDITEIEMLTSTTDKLTEHAFGVITLILTVKETSA
jgi:hypothetical protein